MKITIPFRIQKAPGTRAQAIVEFALVLMVLMVILVGILEVGRLMFMYAAVNNASREAARYASAIGLDDSGNYLKYQHCTGIREMARRSAFFTPLTITISYDHGPGTTAFDSCDGTVDTGVTVNSGTNLDRVYITVNANYSPMVNLIPIGSRTLTSVSARTISGYVDLDFPNPSTSRTPTSSVPTTPGTTAPSETPTATATAPSATSTATVPWQAATATLWPSSTPTLIPSITPTGTLTIIPTETPTPTLTLTPPGTGTATITFTPTITPTSVTDCGDITAESISYSGNTMSMRITNPNSYSVTVSNVQVVWNAATGQSENRTLSLVSAGLGSTFWTGFSSAGKLTIPAASVIIPGNNATSTIIFTFDYDYANQNSNESIHIDLATPGCESFPIQNP